MDFYYFRRYYDVLCNIILYCICTGLTHVGPKCPWVVVQLRVHVLCQHIRLELAMVLPVEVWMLFVPCDPVSFEYSWRSEYVLACVLV